MEFLREAQGYINLRESHAAALRSAIAEKTNKIRLLQRKNQAQPPTELDPHTRMIDSEQTSNSDEDEEVDRSPISVRSALKQQDSGDFPPNSIQLKVKMLTRREQVFVLDASKTVGELRAKLLTESCLPVTTKVRLIFNAAPLVDDSETLQGANLQNNSKIEMCLKMRG
jgi:hypothetical protein